MGSALKSPPSTTGPPSPPSAPSPLSAPSPPPPSLSSSSFTSWGLPGGGDSRDGWLLELCLAVHEDVSITVVNKYCFSSLSGHGLLESLDNPNGKYRRVTLLFWVVNV